jgi:hypothetical protein
VGHKQMQKMHVKGPSYATFHQLPHSQQASEGMPADNVHNKAMQAGQEACDTHWHASIRPTACTPAATRAVIHKDHQPCIAHAAPQA